MKLLTRKETKSNEQRFIELERVNVEAIQKASLEKSLQLQRLNEEYNTRKLLLDSEIAERQRQIAILRKNEEELTAFFEAKRRESLLPLTEEINRLQALRSENAYYSREIAQCLDRDERIRTDNQQLLKAITGERNKFQSVSSAQLKKLQEQEERSTVSLENARKAISALEKRNVILSAREKELADKEESLKRTEVFLKGKMVLLDQTIALAKQEQKKVDEKRSMLKIALDVAKKKNVWLPPEMKIK